MLVIGACLTLLVSPVAAAGANPDDDEQGSDLLDLSNRYVVVMEEEPLVIQFGQDGLGSSEARTTAQNMKAEHARVLNTAGVDPGVVLHDYTVALNGFATELTETQLDTVMSTDGVMMVVADVVKAPQMHAGPESLDRAGDPEVDGQRVNGEGVVVGIVDRGIWPEHPSFADDGSYDRPPVELGEDGNDACNFGNTAHNPDDAPFGCNNKLIGARQFTTVYETVAGFDDDGFDSARDDGHGTASASTVAGNADVEATEFGTVTGIAPRAHIIAYKACGVLGCAGSDLAAAVDQAVLDGVDVINYSIAGSNPTLGPDDLALLYAAGAGVRVAASAGNAGPDEQTIGSPAFMPWLTAVGATTQQPLLEATVILGNGQAHAGASASGSSGPAPLVDAADAGGDLCVPGTLDPTMVEGAIVLCREGAIARMDKSLAVARAGGVGMVVYNLDNVGDLSPDSHSIPTVHVDLDPGLAIKEYITSSPSPTASIDADEVGEWPDDPTMASFSSRGPARHGGDVIKPDITAPGFHVVVGHAPFTVGEVDNALFAALGGTSTSSAHVAGAFALLAQEHPDWTAGATKSAVMTTADRHVLDNDRVSPATAFAMGSGQLNLGSPTQRGSAFRPGLVYQADHRDYLGFVCGVYPKVFAGQSGTCGLLASLGVPTDAVDLNYPSIGVADLAGTRVVTRTVTSVTREQGWRIYAASVETPEGYEVEVFPPEIRLMSGQTATYQVRISNVNAPLGEWRHGSLTWESEDYSVSSPIAVKGASYTAPASVSGFGETAMASFPIAFGYTGQYSAATHGPESATVFSGTVGQDPDRIFSVEDVAGEGVERHEVTADGAALLRLALPPEAAEIGADLDLFVFGPAGNLMVTGTADGTNELIDLVLPTDGTYSIYVHGWEVPGATTDYELFTWMVSATPGGDLILDSAPSSASLNATENIAVSWAGAIAGEWHLGAVSHSDGFGPTGLTLVEIDNR